MKSVQHSSRSKQQSYKFTNEPQIQAAEIALMKAVFACQAAGLVDDAAETGNILLRVKRRRFGVGSH
jgi:hypothetical protein